MHPLEVYKKGALFCKNNRLLMVILMDAVCKWASNDAPIRRLAASNTTLSTLDRCSCPHPAPVPPAAPKAQQSNPQSAKEKCGKAKSYGSKAPRAARVRRYGWFLLRPPELARHTQRNFCKTGKLFKKVLLH